MRIMAFDYGTKRIGIAVTDPMQIIATGLDTIHPNLIIEFLKKYLLTESVERFIVGEPKQMDNTPSQSAPHVKGFVNLLKQTVKIKNVLTPYQLPYYYKAGWKKRLFDSLPSICRHLDFLYIWINQ
jgi:putative transcription antitermination factor YqgF